MSAPQAADSPGGLKWLKLWKTVGLFVNFTTIQENGAPVSQQFCPAGFQEILSLRSQLQHINHQNMTKT